jgi:DNA-binding NarL/FixJ family response regulator
MTLVLVVDDQELVRAGLAALLRAAPGGPSVIEACDGREAVRVAAAKLPDVILMDLRMPGMDGIAAIREILAEAARDGRDPPRILVLTTFDLDEYVHNALRAGASGFLVKSTPAARLFAAVSAVAAGDLAFTPEITRRLVEAFHRDQDSGRGGTGPSTDAAAAARIGTGAGTGGGEGCDATTPARSPAAELTSRELDVLRMVGMGLSNTDIAAALVVAEATVKTHVYRVMTKLGLASRAQAVVYAYETGLVRPGEAAVPPQRGGGAGQRDYGS